MTRLWQAVPRFLTSDEHCLPLCLDRMCPIFLLQAAPKPFSTDLLFSTCMARQASAAGVPLALDALCIRCFKTIWCGEPHRLFCLGILSRNRTMANVARHLRVSAGCCRQCLWDGLLGALEEEVCPVLASMQFLLRTAVLPTLASRGTP